MKIAFISIYPPQKGSGSENRNYYLFKALSKTHTVRAFSPQFKDTDTMSFSHRIFTLLSMKIPYIERLRHATFSEKVLKELESYDYIQLQEHAMYYFFEKYIPRMKGKIVIDTHNIDYVRFLAEIKEKNFLEKSIGLLIASKIKAMELSAVKRSDKIIVCSDQEKNYYEKFISSKKIYVVPNGANVNNKKFAKMSEENMILFMGLLSYQPNEEGLRYYISKIHPNVCKEVPKAKLYILGKSAPTWLKKAAKNDSRIILKGFVPTVETFIQNAKVCICPILSGSGTRLKVLEYLAMGKPVVSTSIGAEGIKIKDQRDIFIANDPEKFAFLIEKILLNKIPIKSVQYNAKKLIRREYSWKNIGKNLSNLYKTNL